jgi:hypothetical protein
VIYLIIGGCVVTISLILAFVPKLVEVARIKEKANADFERCRGTHHARELRAAIDKHELALGRLMQEKRRIVAELDALAQSEAQEMERVVTLQLLNGSFLEVPGIGPRLKERIVHACFNGSLESLLRSQHVHGIGAEKAYAIRTWVQNMQRRLPQLVKGDFSGKDEIRAKYEVRKKELTASHGRVEKAIAPRERVIKLAYSALEPLESITSSTFRQALNGDRRAAEKIATHNVGAFAEWEAIPQWFSDVMKEPRKDALEA